jgi:NAD(P)-dependent dehydrogenase (short-subunit alcohol dehydrogenase family)
MTPRPPGDVPLDLGLAGRAVVVTGAGGGIGRAVAATFARAGAHVLAVDRDAGALDELRASIGDDHAFRAADLGDLAGHGGLFEEATRRFGRVDALAHLAAVLRRRDTIDDVTEEDWDVQIDVNLKATFFLARAAARALRDQGRGGAIVNFTSQGWWSGGFGGSVVYAASKGGIVSMSRGLARTLAPHGIRVNTVAPGAADTAMMRSDQTDEQLAAFVGMIPLGRMAEPDELAGIVAFLVSDHARYITGATINVTGGQIMY